MELLKVARERCIKQMICLTETGDAQIESERFDYSNL